MSDDLFDRLLMEVNAWKQRIRLCLMLQNEPFLDRRMISFLARAHEASGIDTVSVVTNGSTLTGQVLKRITGFDRLRLTISINTLDAAEYRAVHGRDRWNRIHDLLTAWEGDRRRLRISCVVQGQQGIRAARAFDDYWRSHGYGVRFVPVNSRAGSLTDSGSPRWDEFDYDYGHCQYPVDTLAVLATGRVILCCNDWGHDTGFGDLKRQSILEVWNSPQLRLMRHSAIEGRIRETSAMCATCDYPMRSSRRVLLEAAIRGEASSDRGLSEMVAHITEVRPTDGGNPFEVEVVHVDPTSGVLAALRRRGVAPADAVEVRLPVGHEGLLSFGRLSDVWIPARCSRVSGQTIDDETELLLFILDRTAPEARLLEWYAADWQRVTSMENLRNENFSTM